MQPPHAQKTDNKQGSDQEKQPKISLPKGGGAIQGIGEKFQVNPVTGTGSLSIPIAMSPGRSGFTPQLTLSYDSGAGNSPFGMGWGVSIPSISRKTQKGIPRYEDEKESDIFLLSGAEDLVPVLTEQPDGSWKKEKVDDSEYTIYNGETYDVYRYRPRIEGLFARIEKWTNPASGHTFWKSITKENITTIYGQSEDAQIVHPGDETKVFQWLIERTFDDKGNIIHYEYKKEDDKNIPKKLSEKNRPPCSQRYLKKVHYGNTRPYVSGGISHEEPDWDTWSHPDHNTWLFELVFDYGEHIAGEEIGPDEIPSYDPQKEWPCRLDPFSSFRSGFDIRTYRLCRSILMFHRFKELWKDQNGDIIEDKKHLPVLVRSTDLFYDRNEEQETVGNPLATKLKKVSHSSYRKFPGESEDYEKAGIPETEFKYTGPETYDKPKPEFTIHSVDPEYMDNLPQGIDGNRYRWYDLYGEGIGGILAQTPGAWYYKPNLGTYFDDEGIEHVQFGPMQKVAEQPAGANLFQPEQQLVDLGGDGQQNLVIQSPALSGYYEIDDDGHWKNFRSFEADPNVNWGDPNLRLIDLTGDGHADILITEDHCFVWHLSKAEAGFDSAERVHKALDEEAGPRIVFNDGTQSIYLTDMTGDGLIDIARIRNGEICYWANQGYGRFSSKIRMDNCPVFDNPDQFNQRNIRLADIDGSGTTDIFYLGNGEGRYWHNESGNGWCKAHVIPNFPRIDNLATVQVLDLKGKGTASLVWSSPLPGEADAPLQYIDLMSRKPHLMVEVNNNMGAVTKLEYKASTHFYLKDKKAGTPWITKIPFPVHVLVRQETHDEISGNAFVARYAYHHGYFDGWEREFRGFGMVEQWDTEDYVHLYQDDSFTPPGNNWSEETDVPPVYTKTWFHTGAYIGRDNISNFYETEYYDKDPQAWLLNDTILPPGLTTEEEREACRALKGSLLRQEVYALDKIVDEEGNLIENPIARYPYTVTESNYTIQCLQPEGPNRYAVFLVTPRESLSYHYERDPEDPRIAHTANLRVDRYGNTTHSVSIVYPRRPSKEDNEVYPVEQLKLYATASENSFIHKDGTEENIPDSEKYYWCRHSLPIESRSFELHGLENEFDWTDEDRNKKLSFSFLQDTLLQEEDEESVLFNPGIIIDYTTIPEDDQISLRLLNHSKIRYFKNSLNIHDPCDFGEVESLAIPYETYTLAFTGNILAHPELENKIKPDLLAEVGYLSSQELLGIEEEAWWIPSGRQLYFAPDYQEDPATRFYLPVGERTPLGTGEANPDAQESYVYYDHHDDPENDSYYLFVEKAVDPLDNALQVDDFDYRLLQVRAMRDINNNRSAVAFDIRGMVIATALMGKEGGEEGDRLINVKEIHSTSEKGHLEEILANPDEHIGGATTYFYYDVFTWQRVAKSGGNLKLPPELTPVPSHAVGLSREIHRFDLEEGQESPIQKAVTYSDGFGREILTKVQAEEGMAPTFDDEGNLILDANEEPVLAETSDRWVGNGRTIFNNKGKPVKQYEPFFDSNPYFTDEEALVHFGVTLVIHYDPLTRVIRTDFPDRTFSKVEFTPWEQINWDQNDTVLEPDCQWYNDRISGALGPEAQRAARLTANHAGTFTKGYLDTLGRTFLTVAHNRTYRKLNGEEIIEEIWIPTRTELDIQGNPLLIKDSRGITPDDDPEIFTYPSGNRVMTYLYAMGGLQLFQESMDAGRRWSLVDVLGNPIHGWDQRGHYLRTEYDDLQRPTHLWVEKDGAAQLVERLLYGEALDDPDTEEDEAAALNYRGELILHFDGAGLAKSDAFDFKGNLLAGSRILAKGYQEVPQWADLDKAQLRTLLAELGNLVNGNPSVLDDLLESEEFTSSTAFDALNRPSQSITPDGSITDITYNKANLHETIRAMLPGNDQPVEKTFVTGVAYNARGQREEIKYGNGTTTTYTYDDETFRLTRMKTTRSPQDPDGNPRAPIVQDLHYTYDPVGNITEIRDDAIEPAFFRNQQVDGKSQYVYDALYQLTQATGREQYRPNGHPPGNQDIPLLESNFPITEKTLRNYTQRYFYDTVGNILRMQHSALDGNWTREYFYEEEINNRLTRTTPFKCNDQGTYTYDANGNMITMPHLHCLDWDYKDQLIRVQCDPDCADDPEESKEPQNRKVYYTYDSRRQRVRKVYRVGNRIKERIYLGDYEIYREWDANHEVFKEELQTLHVMDDQSRICMVETTTIEDGEEPIANSEARFRYQLSNHLGSSTVELDLNAEVITYDEYHPYGTSSFRAKNTSNSIVEVSPKRYRYTGMERDEETGLNYHTARYYLPWLGRWGSCDPKGAIDCLNLFVYAIQNPLIQNDIKGTKVRYENKKLKNRIRNLAKNNSTFSLILSEIMKSEKTLEVISPKTSYDILRNELEIELEKFEIDVKKFEKESGKLAFWEKNRMKQSLITEYLGIFGYKTIKLPGSKEEQIQIASFEEYSKGNIGGRFFEMHGKFYLDIMQSKRGSIYHEFGHALGRFIFPEDYKKRINSRIFSAFRDKEEVFAVLVSYILSKKMGTEGVNFSYGEDSYVLPEDIEMRIDFLVHRKYVDIEVFHAELSSLTDRIASFVEKTESEKLKENPRKPQEVNMEEMDEWFEEHMKKESLK